MEARYRTQDSLGWESGEIRDLSAGGAALRTVGELPLASVLVPLEFELPGEEGSIRVVATVLRCQPEEDGTFRSGLHFLDLRGEEYERVRLFVFRGLQAG